ncbi:MAG TPA: DUF5659 domain-containing protein [Verrucomicrobiae bacterium]|nr:DUF5659 domain-containing protein [Verrucomicrobiae bacterium]
MNTAENYYETSDLGLAAALLACNVLLVRVNKENPRRAVFVFVESTEVNSLVQEYWNGSLAVGALGYFENTKRLKSRIYGE